MNNMPWHVDRREIMNPHTALSEGPRGASQNQSYIPPEMRSLEALKHKNWIRGPSLSDMFVMFVNGLNVAGWDNVDHQGYALHGKMQLEGLRQDGSQSAESRADT